MHIFFHYYFISFLSFVCFCHPLIISRNRQFLSDYSFRFVSSNSATTTPCIEFVQGKKSTKQRENLIFWILLFIFPVFLSLERHTADTHGLTRMQNFFTLSYIWDVEQICMCVSILGEFEKYNLFLVHIEKKVSTTYMDCVAPPFLKVHPIEKETKKNLLSISDPC